MGILSKLAFWKRKDDFGSIGKDFDLGKDFGMEQGPSPDLGLGLEPLPQQPLQKYGSFQQPQQGFSSQAYPAMQPYPSAYPGNQSFPNNSSDSVIASKNLEVISSKLDALKASMDALNQRVANIEAIARGEQEDQRRRRYY